ncbi:hypothetical protein L484_015071 [Morus notabilis]|uniref:Uncharacterized protein n=1 Tax=Morus notabilis TaxID=981085 RepID=W9S777_9ROSA|nr:hypothetical protein L484_015071 [Morus notabilis]
MKASPVVGGHLTDKQIEAFKSPFVDFGVVRARKGHLFGRRCWPRLGWARPE